MGHLMPGHVLSLTAGAVAYESKCALKISFSSRDAADKELARARTSYGISYVASTYLISGVSLSLSLSLPSFLFFLFIFLSLFLSFSPTNNLHPLRCQRNFPISIGKGAKSRSVNDGILYAALVPSPILSSIRKHPLRCRDRMQLHRG